MLAFFFCVRWLDQTIRRCLIWLKIEANTPITARFKQFVILTETALSDIIKA